MVAARALKRCLKTVCAVGLGLFGLASILATGGGSGSTLAPPDGSGPTRRFDQYPVLVDISGNSVFVIGQQRSLTLVADTTEFSENLTLQNDQTYGVDVMIDDTAFITAPRAYLASDGVDSGRTAAQIPLQARGESSTQVRRIELRASNPRSQLSRTLFVVPAGRNYLASFDISNPIVVSGSAVEGVLTLAQPAPAGGAVVALTSASTRVTIPAEVAVAAGQTVARFAIVGQIDALQEFATIVAAYDGVEQQAGVWVRALQPFLLQLSIPGTLSTGTEPEPRRVSGFIRLSGPAVAGRMVVLLSSNNSLVTFPDTLTALDGRAALPLAGGDVLVNFEMLVAPLFELSSVRITAELQRDDGQGVRVVNSRVADAQLGSPQIADLASVGYTTQTPGDPGLSVGNCLSEFRDDVINVTVNLDRPAPANYLMEIYTGTPTVLRLNRTFAVPEGSSQVTLTADIVSAGPREDSDIQPHASITVRSLRTGKSLTSHWWVRFEDFSTRPVIDAFQIDTNTPRGGSVLTGSFSIKTNNKVDDLPVDVTVFPDGENNIAVSRLVWKASNDDETTVPFALALPTVTVPTTLNVLAYQTNSCAGEPATGAVGFPQTITVIPGGLLGDISLAQPQLFGGESTQLTVRLNQPAGNGGVSVALSASFGDVQLPPSVFVPEGSDVATVTVTTLSTSVFRERRITASADGIEDTISIFLMPEPTAIQLFISPGSVSGGQTVTVSASLNTAYPIDLNAVLTSDSAALPLPGSLLLRSTTTTPSSGSVAVTTLPVTAAGTASVTAQFRGVSTTAQVQIVPAPGSGATSLLRIERTGSGSGTVVTVGDSQGINCPGDCEERYEVGAEVQVRATAASGSGFAGWIQSDGQCSAIVDTAEGSICTVTISGADRVLQAQFNDVPAVWTRLGTGLFNDAAQTGRIGSSFAVTAAGLPIAVWRENFGLYVKRWNGNAWEAMGEAQGVGAMQPVDGFPVIAVDGNGDPWIAWQEGTFAVHDVYVKRWNGSSWVVVGGGPVDVSLAANARDPLLRVNASGQPVLAWLEADRVIVRYFDGTAWRNFGAEAGPSSGTNVAAPSLQVTANGVAYVAWIDGEFGSEQVRVSRGDANGWQSVGAPVNPTLLTEAFMELSLDPQGAPMVVFASGQPSNAVNVRRWDGAQWAQLGTPMVADQFTRIQDVSIDATRGSQPLVAWSNNAGNARVVVARWDGTSWVQVGGSTENGSISPGGRIVYLSISDGAAPQLLTTNSVGGFIGTVIDVWRY